MKEKWKTQPLLNSPNQVLLIFHDGQLFLVQKRQKYSITAAEKKELCSGN